MNTSRMISGPFSFSDEKGDGVKVTFPFSFVGPAPGYLTLDSIYVYLRDADPSSPTYGEFSELPGPYLFPTKNTVTLPTAPPLPLDGKPNIRVRRVVDKGQPYADPNSGDIFRKSVLYNSFLLQLYAQHEVLDGYSQGSTLPDAGGLLYDLNANGNRIYNLGDAIRDDDAASLGQVKLLISSLVGSGLQPVVFETLRRSCAEAGYNLVNGSFEVGGTLVNPNDALLQELTGKVFTGPAGNVPAGTNPVGSGFVDISEVLLRDLAAPRELSSEELSIKEGDDVTSLLTELAPRIKADNITSIKMKVNASFSGTLPFAYNRVAFSSDSLTGAGRLAIDKTENILQALPTTRSPYKVYSGKLNGMLLDNQNTKSAIEVRKELRVVLLGDSIGVTSDWDSQSVAPGQRMIQGVDNFSTVNALGFLLFQEICAAVGRGVRVKFYSRCVGGKSYVNLGAAWDSPALDAPWTGREQCTPGKAWVNCVLDLEPDLVLHEMGMNHGATDYLDSFVSNWHSKLIETGRMGTFDQALITTPSPNFEDAGQFGDFRQFCTPMFYVAQQQRFVANKYGMSLIDVSFLSFLKRYGIDSRSCVMSKDYAQVLIDGSNSVTIAAKSGKAFQHPNNPIFHQTTLTINQNAGAALDFRVNFGDGVIVQFGQTSISIINGFFSSMSTSKTVAYAMPDSTDVTFTVQVLPHGVFVYAGSNGETLLLVNDITAYTTTVGGLMQNSSASGTVTVKDIKVFEGEFPRYAADTSTVEMYGVLDYTQNPFGGGINHPSNKGLSEVYLPPFREFCTRLTEGGHGAYVNNQLDMSDNDLIYIGSVETIPYSVSEFWDDTSLSYLRVKYNSIGVLQSIENRTGMSIYYNARGDVYAKVSGGKKVKGMRYSGCWRKFGGWVVNAVHAPLRLVGFTEVAANFSTAIETFENGKITRVDVVEVASGTVYDFPLDFTPNIFIGARATISVNSDSPHMVQLADTVQVTSSSNSGKLHYHCTFETSAETTPRRIMFESTYILK